MGNDKSFEEWSAQCERGFRDRLAVLTKQYGGRIIVFDGERVIDSSNIVFDGNKVINYRKNLLEMVDKYVQSKQSAKLFYVPREGEEFYVWLPQWKRTLVLELEKH